MQGDPTKSVLKAPGGSKHQKLEEEKLLSNFDFNFNLRRYFMGVLQRVLTQRLAAYPTTAEEDEDALKMYREEIESTSASSAASKVGRYGLTPG